MATDGEIVTIDGPASSGKSSVSKAVAKALGYRHLDTGAMYRAVTFACLRAGIAPRPADALRLRELLGRLELELDGDGGVRLAGEDVREAIRSPAVSQAVSEFAALSEVREVLVERQRRFARQPGGVVAEGRDMASVVFPLARHQFYLDASPRERARRRLEQMRARGVAPLPALDELASQLERRDNQDRTRSIAPLSETSGAELIDTTQMSEEVVVRTLLDRIKHRRALDPA
jgi:cytidylate kinase